MAEKIVIGADMGGFGAKEAAKAHLEKLGYEVIDVGTLSEDNPVAYYDVAYLGGKMVATGECKRGILFCGTGMGVSLIANKFPGVYCGVVESVYTAQMCRHINDCNMLALGGFLNGNEKTLAIVDAFLNAEFAPKDFWLDHDMLSGAYEKVKETEAKIRKEFA